MRYLHTMLRVRDLNAALDFYCNKLGLKEVRRRDDDKGRYTNVFLAAPDDGTSVAGSRQAGRGGRQPPAGHGSVGPGNGGCRLTFSPRLPVLARPGERLYMSARFQTAAFPRPSSSGPGRRPFTAVTRVRVP